MKAYDEDYWFPAVFLTRKKVNEMEAAGISTIEVWELAGDDDETFPSYG